MASVSRGLTSKSIDMILLTKDKAGLDLLVLDIGDLPDPEKRLAAFEGKLLLLANFVADGQYKEHAPNIDPSRITVRFVCKDPPISEMANCHAIRATGPNQASIELRVTVETEPEFAKRIESELGVRPPPLFVETEKRPWWRFW